MFQEWRFPLNSLQSLTVFILAFVLLVQYELYLPGRSQDFSKGGGGRGHTGPNNIVMAFSPRNIVGCLLKKGLQRGGGGGGSRAPQDPLATPLMYYMLYASKKTHIKDYVPYIEEERDTGNYNNNKVFTFVSRFVFTCDVDRDVLTTYF